MADTYWECEYCGKTFSKKTLSHARNADDGRGNEIAVECGPITQRTTDNNADLVYTHTLYPNAAADTQHTASPVSDSPTQPAAPTLTPWTDKAWLRESSDGLRNHARRLEALVHRQQEAFTRMLSEETDWANGQIGVGYKFRAIARTASAAYVALEKEIGK